MSLRSLIQTGLFVLATTAAARAQQPAVGDPAPAIVATSWLNWEGAAPSLESQKGRVVLIEFWGTWCAPCVRAMPGIQKLFDRYHERGLTVLAISYEDTTTLQGFLKKNSYTMPAGSDPEKKTITAYGIRGWPTTILIDKEGKIAHVGSPYDAEAAVEKALGLEAGPGPLLTLYFDSLKDPAKNVQRGALERLVQKAPPDFDLQSWAKSLTPPETISTEGTPTPAAAPVKPASKPADPADLLRRCAKVWSSDAAQRAQLLQQLGDSGPTKFDLAAFAQDSFAKAFPFEAAELKSLLEEKKYAVIVEAIATRQPAPAVLAAAAKNIGLAVYCNGKAPEAHTWAKKGLMAQLWLFPGFSPRDEKGNTAFFDELSVSGIATSKDNSAVIGITLGGEMVMTERIESFVKSQLTQALLMDDLASGKPPRLRELQKLYDQEHTAIVRDLEGRYGKPEPSAKK